MDRQKVLRRRLAVTLMVAVAAVGVMILFVFPLRTLLDQNHQIGTARSQIEALNKQDAELKNRIAYLKSNQGVAAQAHDRFGWIWPGQEAYSITPAATTTTVPPTTVPTTKGSK